MDSSFIISFFIKNALPPTLLILGIAAVRKLFVRLPKKLLYVLWTTLTLRLLIPFSAGLPLLPAGKTAPEYAVYGMTEVHRAGFSVTAAGNVSEYSPSAWNGVSVSDIIVGLYIAAASAMAVYFALGHIRGVRKYRFSLPVPRKETAEMTEALGIKRVNIRSCRGASPAAFGIFIPTVIIPGEADGRTHILAHELVHIKRRDPLLLTLLTAALCIHWSNPAVWLMYSLARRDMELSCDEEAVRVFSIPSKEYAMTLISMEERRSDRFAAFGKKPVAERIEQLVKGTAPMNRAAVAAVSVISGLMFTSLEYAPRTADELVTSAEFSAYEDNYVYEETDDGGTVSRHTYYYDEPTAEAFYEEAPAESEHRISREKTVLYSILENIPEFQGETAVEAAPTHAVEAAAAGTFPVGQYAVSVTADDVYEDVYIISDTPVQVQETEVLPDTKITVASEAPAEAAR